MGTEQAPVKRCDRQLRDLTIPVRAAPSFIVSHEVALTDGPAAYDMFDKFDGYTRYFSSRTSDGHAGPVVSQLRPPPPEASSPGVRCSSPRPPTTSATRVGQLSGAVSSTLMSSGSWNDRIAIPASVSSLISPCSMPASVSALAAASSSTREATAKLA